MFDVIRLSKKTPLTSVRSVNFRVLYKQVWSITGTLPEHICDIFRSSVEPSCPIFIFRNASLALAKWSDSPHVLDESCQFPGLDVYRLAAGFFSSQLPVKQTVLTVIQYRQ